MSISEPEDIAIKPGAIRRRPVILSKQELTESYLLEPGASLPLVVKPLVEGVNLPTWAASNKELLEAQLLKHGAILLRDFEIGGVTGFEQFIKVISGELLQYHERSSPRHQVSGNIYTSTDYPTSQSIFLHNENSYQRVWPLKIFFHCVTPAEEGGETPIADVRKVFQRIDPEIRKQFLQKGVMYVRNYGDGFGLSWPVVFQTTDKAAVNEYCRNSDIEVEWKNDSQLRTRQVAEAIRRHPITGEMLWFNHAAFFHVTTLDPMLSKVLLEQYENLDLPNNTYYGDGSPIEPSILDHIRESYQRETVAFPWQKGDVLMLDNMLVAHGRSRYKGSRTILAGMSEPYSGTTV